jgi:hypothetical protein
VTGGSVGQRAASAPLILHRGVAGGRDGIRMAILRRASLEEDHARVLDAGIRTGGSVTGAGSSRICRSTEPSRVS